MEEVSEIKYCEPTSHNFIPIAWQSSLFCKAAAKLACSKCGKVINSGIKWESDE